MMNHIFKITNLQTSEEYYTETKPLLEDESLLCDNLIKKSKLTETVLTGETIDQFYSEKVESKALINFALLQGIQLSIVDKSTLHWFITTKEQAETELKDKMLLYYKTVMPKLVTDFNNLKTEFSKLKTGQQQIVPHKNLYV